jgi:hypothetical protein
MLSKEINQLSISCPTCQSCIVLQPISVAPPPTPDKFAGYPIQSTSGSDNQYIPNVPVVAGNHQTQGIVPKILLTSNMIAQTALEKKWAINAERMRRYRAHQKAIRDAQPQTQPQTQSVMAHTHEITQTETGLGMALRDTQSVMAPTPHTHEVTQTEAERKRALNTEKVRRYRARLKLLKEAQQSTAARPDNTAGVSSQPKKQ